MTFRGQWLMTRGGCRVVRGGRTLGPGPSRVYGYRSEAVRDADVSIAAKEGLVPVIPASGLWVDGTTCYKLEVSCD